MPYKHDQWCSGNEQLAGPLFFMAQTTENVRQSSIQIVREQIQKKQQRQHAVFFNFSHFSLLRKKKQIKHTNGWTYTIDVKTVCRAGTWFCIRRRVCVCVCEIENAHVVNCFTQQWIMKIVWRSGHSHTTSQSSFQS